MLLLKYVYLKTILWYNSMFLRPDTILTKQLHIMLICFVLTVGFWALDCSLLLLRALFMKVWSTVSLQNRKKLVSFSFFFFFRTTFIYLFIYLMCFSVIYLCTDLVITRLIVQHLLCEIWVYFQFWIVPDLKTQQGNAYKVYKEGKKQKTKNY